MDYSSIFIDILQWFDTYTASFQRIDKECDNAVSLKYDHTRRVCQITEFISDSIRSTTRETAISKIIAILHDVGRYEQFLKYRTFSDHLSINHAEFAIQIIDEKKVLNALSDSDAEIIKIAILSHSSRTLPPSIDTLTRQFCNIIRDSDKLDIYHIATSHYKNPDIERKSFELGLTDNKSYTPEICETVYNGKMVDYKSIRYLNDFKLAQIAWVYDLNFTCSFKYLNDRGYLQMLSSELPHTDEISRAVGKAKEFLRLNLLKSDL